MSQRAILIGINQYHKNIEPLNGCINDVNRIFSILTGYYNFPSTSILPLLNPTAKKGVILYNLKELITDSKSGDTLVFYFAGHGAQVAALDDTGEVDHLDEVLCPWDYDENNPDTYIRDKDLIRLFAGIQPGVNLEVILDCCFSGGMSRILSLLNFFKKSRPQIRSLTKRTRKSKTARRFLSISSTPSRGTVKSTNNFILWAACSENQEAKEDEVSEDVFRGVFSYYFCETIERNGGGITRGDLFNELKNRLANNQYSQDPPLYTRADSDLQRPLFS